MSRDDWYRNESWTKEIAEAFWERLHRSRTSFHKAQYLRIQALYLVESGHNEAALGLLQRLADVDSS